MGIAYGPTQNWLNNTPQGFQYRIDNNFYVKDGLVLYLDAGDSNSYPGTGTTWTDLSGNDNNGTLVNGVGYSGSDGGSLVFDANNEYSTIPATSNFDFGQDDFTISCFFKNNIKSVSQTDRRYLIHNETSWNGTRWVLYSSIDNNTDKAVFYTYPTFSTNGNLPLLVSSTTLNTSDWYNVVVSRINNTISLYLNGVQEDSETITTAVGDSSYTTYIASGTTQTDRGLFGNISNILIYKNKGLTPEEVQLNYNIFKGRYGL